MRFHRKVAIVTGGGRGIGRAIVDQLCREGALVAAFDVTTEVWDSLSTERGSGGEVAALPVDVRDPRLVEDGMAAVVDRWGRLDVLVNNAAVSPVIPILDMTEEVWDKVIDVNLKGVWLSTRAAVPHLRRSAGCI